MTEDFRIEHDSMGPMRVPTSAYFGAQTARAVENFPISGLRFSRPFIRAIGLIKKHAAASNASLGRLPAELAKHIQLAAAEVAEGKWDSQFVVDIFQTGSATSTNMNANEVIANRASELLAGDRASPRIHPNDHVNCGQSSNDVIPSAIHIAALEMIQRELLPALEELRETLHKKALEFHAILKIGRTHLQDATPIRLGQEFGGYASQVEHGIARVKNVLPHLSELALGGTAVGTGLNTHIDFARRTIQGIADDTRLALREAPDHFEAQGARDACVEVSGTLRTIAVSLIKIANDIRLLASGPRLGLGELKLPSTQPGSSIMPGKINPVMCEMLIQVGAQVMGNDVTVAFSGTFGHLELNVMMPIIAYNLLQSIEILATGSRTFARRCVAGIEVNREVCAANLEKSLALCTVLAPKIGYDRAAAIARMAYESGRTVREVALDQSGLDAARLDVLLSPDKQTRPDPV